MLFSGFDQLRHLFLSFGINDKIWNTAELGVLDGVHLFLGMSMTVAKTDPAIGFDLVWSQEPLKFIAKRLLDVRVRNQGGIGWGVGILRIDAACENLPHPRQESRQLFSAE